MSVNCDPNALIQAARCFKCIPPGMQQEVITYLLCQIAQGGGGGASRGDGTFGLFSVGDSGATGDIVINDTTCIPGYNIGAEPNMTGLSFPNLTNIDSGNVQAGTFNCNGNPSLKFIDLPVVVVVNGGLGCFSNASMVSVSAPLAVSITGSVDMSGCPLLTTVDLQSWVPLDGSHINFNGDALSSSSVELILRRCVLAGVTTCIIDLSGGTNAGTASLNAQGQADVVTLGAQLTINP